MSQAVNNAESIRTWLRTCPDIANSRYFGADFLSGKAGDYAILTVPSTLKYKENIIGQSVLQQKQSQNYVFAAELPYGSDFKRNLANLQFCQNVANWITQQNRTENYPKWDNGRIVSIECSNTGAPVRTDVDMARYQFQFRINYEIY